MQGLCTSTPDLERHLAICLLNLRDLEVFVLVFGIQSKDCL
jgi:hypothetical protein